MTSFVSDAVGFHQDHPQPRCQRGSFLHHPRTFGISILRRARPDPHPDAYPGPHMSHRYPRQRRRCRTAQRGSHLCAPRATPADRNGWSRRDRRSREPRETAEDCRVGEETRPRHCARGARYSRPIYQLLVAEEERRQSVLWS